jgi:hypothetical protein
MIDNAIWINPIHKGWESQCLEGGVAACKDGECARMIANCFKPGCKSCLDGVQSLQDRFVLMPEEGNACNKGINTYAHRPAKA